MKTRNPPFLSGSRVVLRLIEQDEIGIVEAWGRCPALCRAVGPGLVPRTRQQIQEMVARPLRSNEVMLGVSYGEVLIGIVRIANISWRNHGAQLRYAIADPRYRYQGLGTDAVAAAVSCAFARFGLHRLRAHVHEDNAASMRVLEKNGFAPVKRKRGYYVRSEGAGSWARNKNTCRRESPVRCCCDQIIYELRH